MKNLVWGLFILITATQALFSACPEFLDEKRDDFVHRIVDLEDRHAFIVFYEDFVQKQKQRKIKNEKKWKQEVDRILELGRNSLEVKHPVWAQQLQAYSDTTIFPLASNDNDRVSLFLFRYGAHEEFLRKKAAKQNSIWTKTCSYGRDVGNTIVSWFGSWKRSKTTAS